MEQWLIDYQAWCRIGLFILAFSLLSAWETASTWRVWLVSRRTRLLRHFSLSVISKISVRVMYPLFAMTFAVAVQHKGLGVLRKVHLPYFIYLILGVIGLDLIYYMQHRLMHKYKWLWRIHRIHHMDRQLDVSTGIRFHPIEELITMGVKLLGIAFFGVLPISVFIFEVLLNLATMFAHVNARLSFKVDNALRYIFISPGMHRIHHSDHPPETNSNYGFIFSLWDKLLGTYTFISSSGERKMVFGLEEYRDPKYQTVQNMLLLPFNPRSLRLKQHKKMKLKLGMQEK